MRRQRSDQFSVGIGQNFADLRQTDFNLAFSDGFAGCAQQQFELGFQFVRNIEFLE